jgi:hypothetical protein
MPCCRVRRHTIYNDGVDGWLDAHTLRLRLQRGHELRRPVGGGFLLERESALSRC